MFKKLKKILYAEIYINIIANTKETTIYVEELYANGSSNNYEEIFSSSKKASIYEYIQSFAKKSPIHYISILDNSTSCGAMLSCSEAEISEDDFKSICVSDVWSYYTLKADLLELQGRYHKTGLDFIFSPFIILSNFFKDKIVSDVAMYILINEDNLTLSVFENSKLLFAQYADMQNKELNLNDDLLMDIDDEELDSSDTISVDLESVNVDVEIESIDEFDDMQDLETFDDMDEFSQNPIEEKFSTDKIDVTLEEQGDFGVDYHRFSLIQSAINDFYKNSKFDSKFIETVYIADTVGISNELKKFLEEEMFLSVYVRKMDFGNELCELAKVEPK